MHTRHKQTRHSFTTNDTQPFVPTMSRTHSYLHMHIHTHTHKHTRILSFITSTLPLLWLFTLTNYTSPPLLTPTVCQKHTNPTPTEIMDKQRGKDYRSRSYICGKCRFFLEGPARVAEKSTALTTLTTIKPPINSPPTRYILFAILDPGSPCKLSVN